MDARANKMVLAIIVCFCTVFGLWALVSNAYSTSEVAVVTNATDSDITVSYSFRVKGRTETIRYRIPPGGTEKTGILDDHFAVETKETYRLYRSVKMPGAASYIVDFHGYFKERLVNMTLHEDGCMHVTAAGAPGGKSLASQPEGFPLCADKRPE